MDRENIILEMLVKSGEKDKLEKAKEKLQTLTDQQVSHLVEEKTNAVKNYYRTYDEQYYNIVNTESNEELKQRMVDELGRLAFGRRQTLENEFVDKILKL